MPKRSKKVLKSARTALKIEALEQRQLLAGGFVSISIGRVALRPTFLGPVDLQAALTWRDANGHAP